MVIVDANVLLHAANSASPDHEAGRTWLDRSLAGSEAVGLPWMSLLAFLRVGTNPRAFPVPFQVDKATEQVRWWLAEPGAIVPHPTSRHLDVMAGLLRRVGRGGNLVPDAHLAALAVEHDATVVSFDRDFARFEGVRHRLPG